MEGTEKLTLSVKEMAAALGISVATAYDLTHRADFPVIHLGRRKIIPKDALYRWVNEQMDNQIDSK